MRKFVFLALALALGFVVTALPTAQSGGDASYTPKRINKAVELLAAGDRSITSSFLVGAMKKAVAMRRPGLMHWLNVSRPV
ncbi:MAG: hypothetical protein CM1200mP25_4980 [Acidobacteriota bacterium]|nr:MAG: hypothetical protein CM1200mP25_4980 [Acidobacteriota bacterium]